jgi:hypothetical protein
MGMISTAEMCKRTGATYRRVDYWTRQGVVCPTIDCAGSGSRRKWAERQVRIVHMVSDLSNLGATEPVLKAAVRSIELWPLDEWWGVAYVDEDGVVSRSHPGGSCYVVDLALCATGGEVVSQLAFV